MNEEEFKELFEDKTLDGIEVKFLDYRQGTKYPIFVTLNNGTLKRPSGILSYRVTGEPNGVCATDRGYYLVRKEKPWPSVGSVYYTLNEAGVVRLGLLNNKEEVSSLTKFGMIYKTREEAEHKRDKQFATVRVVEKMKEFMEGREFDWDGDEWKHSITYNHESKQLESISWLFKRHYPNSQYTTKYGCKWILENMEDDLKLMFDVEE